VPAPLVWIAAAWLVGSVAAHELPELPNAGWAVPLLLMALLALRYALLRPLLVAAIAAAWTCWCASGRLAESLPAAALGADFELAGTVADRLARAIRALVLTLGVNHIVIGGGVAAAGEALLSPVLAAIDAERAASPLVDAAFREARVELLSPQAEAGARGAAQIARQRVTARQREVVSER